MFDYFGAAASIKDDENCSIALPSIMSMNTLVLVYGAVVCSNKSLADIGNFVEVKSTEVSYICTN